MKYFEMFTGIAGFSKGIERAYADDYQHESTKSEATDCPSGRLGIADIGQHGIRSANNSALYNGRGQRMPECVGFSEIGKIANGILKYRYPNILNYGDATGIVCDELPDFDFLCGGFPCQAFSIAGKRQGFNEARGTMFFEIARILSYKRPGHFLFENVEGLRSHEEGKTLQEILRILAELDYRVEVVLLNSKHYGVPQNRERVFFIGHLGRECAREILSFGQDDRTIDDLQGQQANTVTARYFGAQATGTYIAEREFDAQEEMIQVGTLRTHKDGQGFRPMSDEVSPSLNARARQDGSQQTVVAIPILTPDGATKRQNGRRMKDDGEACFTITAQDRYGVMVAVNNERADNRVNRIRRFTPVECARLQGFDDDWADFGLFENKQGEWHVKKISDTGKYQVFGNAVTVNVIEAIIRAMRQKGCLGL